MQNILYFKDYSLNKTRNNKELKRRARNRKGLTQLKNKRNNCRLI